MGSGSMARVTMVALPPLLFALYLSLNNRITLFLLVLQLLPCAVASSSSEPAVTRSELDESVSRAVSFLRSERDPATMLWHPLETPSAVLGLSSGDSLWRRSKLGPEHVQVMTALRLSVVDRIARHDGDLSAAFDDSTFAQILSAVQVSCMNATDFHGRDLLAEGARRLRSAKQRSPALAGLALPLCNAGFPLDARSIRRLSLPRSSRHPDRHLCRSLCVEKAALNVLALTCVLKDESYDRTAHTHASVALLDNVKYIGAHPRAAETYTERNLFETSILLQAKQESPVEIHSAAEDVLLEELLSFQDPEDGSFGGSVSLTAIAIPALSNFNALDIPGAKVECPKAPLAHGGSGGDLVRVDYVIEDAFSNAQTLVGHIDVESGSNIAQTLEAYEKRHPFVIEFEVEKTEFGTRLTSLIGIGESAVVGWNAYVVAAGGGEGEERRAPDLEGVELRRGDRVVFRYERKKRN